ncbi:MAG: hypothetical protein J7M20_00830, partial [Deltaproteobacteria bacterium]|nr:hypothetical protein [Deltaproteobacteria bacterium]
MEHDESIFQPNPALPDTGRKSCIRSGKTEKLIHAGTPCRDWLSRIGWSLRFVKLEIPIDKNAELGKTYYTFYMLITLSANCIAVTISSML